MKKLILAVALDRRLQPHPLLADGFSNPYSTQPLTQHPKGDTTMKKLMLAVALIVASAAPVHGRRLPEQLHDPLEFAAGNRDRWSS